jgi:hypothetical protein
MAEPKTKPTNVSVSAFVAGIEADDKRKDAEQLCKIMRRATGKRAVMWGASIVGFGSYHYRYASGREGDWMLTGFAPRKRGFSVYIMSGFAGFALQLKLLGKHKTAKSCLYVNRLGDVDVNVLETLIRESVELMRARHSCK